MSVLVNVNGTVQDGVVVARNVQGVTPQAPGVSFDLIQLRSGARVYACPMPHAEGPCVAPSHANPRPKPLVKIEIYETDDGENFQVILEFYDPSSKTAYAMPLLKPFPMLLPAIQRQLDHSLKDYYK